MSRPYRPSNGTEGMDFMEEWCFRCKREPEDPTVPGCPILSDTFFYEKSDPRYPKEWVRDEQGPRCTAFDAKGD